VSTNLARAEALNLRNGSIDIVSEAVFRERIGLDRAQRADGGKCFDAIRVCELLDMAPETLRRWEALGLITSDDGLYDFQDLVSLRAIAELVMSGVEPQRLAQTVEGLRGVFRDVDRPLAQLTIVEHSGALLAELGDTLVAPDGQLMLNYDESRSPGTDDVPMTDAAIPLITDGPNTIDAERWFARAAALEDEERFDEAIDAYRRSVALQPTNAEAHFNLGNLLRATDDLEGSETHYRQAVTHDPSLASAWYNLADILEERGRVEDAVESLQRALRAHPGFADAHYNLALCYTELGDIEASRRHWSTYLELDPDSAWANHARLYLQELVEGHRDD
jgi:tetratricopeptide (TPR) repeat protein